MSLPTFQQSMEGFTTKGLTAAEALERRTSAWAWTLGAPLLAPYLDGNDLAACCPVSKEFKNAFLPILWSKPTLILKNKEQAIMKTFHFMETARTASNDLRSLVQVLDFWQLYFIKPTNHSGDPANYEREYLVYNISWLMECTKYFPNLRFVILYGLHYDISWEAASFFELANRQPQITQGQNDAENQSSSSAAPAAVVPKNVKTVRTRIKPILFSAEHCICTSQCATLFMTDTSNMLYLDLSSTKRDPVASIVPRMRFPNLRVLKLRGFQMVDAEFARLAQIGSKLWCLDVRDNLLTDATANLIINDFSLARIKPPRRPTAELEDQDLFEDVPEYHYQDGRPDSVAPLRPDGTYELMDYIEKHTDFPSLNDEFLDANDPLLRHTGLTHLYISANRLTSSGVKTLLIHTNRLQVLDVGAAEARSKSRTYSVDYTTAYAQLNSKSVWGLSWESRSRMEKLRIHHSLVTYVPTLINVASGNNGFTLPLIRQAETVGKARMKEMQRKCQRAFSPLQNYRVTELTLVGIPTKSYGLTIHRLIEFLNDCRTQEEKLEQVRRRGTKSRRAPELLSGLRTLRLEFIPEDRSPRFASVSGDRDADNFHASSDGDFSFFSDPNTMSGVSRRGSVVSTASSGAVKEPTPPPSRKGSIMSGAAMLRTLSGLGSRPGPSTEPPAYELEVKDVAEELKKFRAMKFGRWTGRLELVRRPIDR